MKKLTILLMLTVGAGIHFQAQAQFIKRLKKSVQHKLEDKTIETTEKGIDKAFDKGEEELWESMEKERNQNDDSVYSEDENDNDEAMGGGGMTGLQKKYMKMMGEGTPIEIADEYTFTKKIRYHIISNSEEKQGSMDYTLWLNTEKGYTGGELSNFKDESGKSENEDMSILTIMDNEHEAMIMLMPEQKMATVISTATPEGMEDNMVQVEEVDDDSDVDVSMMKTGRTKKILGYTCEEYEITTSDSESSIWVTNEIEDYNDALLKSMKDDSPFILMEGFGDLEGMVMEMTARTTEDKTGEEVTMVMKVVEISDEPVKFNMGDYQKMNIGGPPSDK